MAGSRTPSLDDGDGWAFGATGLPGADNGLPWRPAMRQSPPGIVHHHAAGRPARAATVGQPHSGAALPQRGLPATDPQHRPLLGWHAHGPYVTEAQRLLNRLTQPSPQLLEDGRFGPRTHAAVVDYQARTQLRVDGLIGPQTWRALLQGRVARDGEMVNRARADEVLTATVPFSRLAPLEPASSPEVLHPFKLHLAPLPLAAPPAWWPRPKGGNPYASEPYAAELTNRSVAARLDGDGRASYTELPPGSCSAAFRQFCEPLKPVFQSSISR